MLWVVIIYNILAVVWIIEVLAIPFEKCREQIFVGDSLFNGELERVIDFFPRANAFKWLSGIWINEANEDIIELFIIK